MKHDKLTAGYCGLFCDSCSKFIGTTEDPSRLQLMSARRGNGIEDHRCLGCRSDTLSYFCKTCAMKECITEKGLDFCSECDAYPCDVLIEFQSQAPHRLELFESLAYAKEHGYEKWYKKMKQDYSCRKCGTINSAYDLSCRNCGKDPSNDFVKRNRASIIKNMKDRSPKQD